MATRSLIGRQRDDGTVTFVYCHSDGYLSHNGVKLLEHYSDSAKLDELLALGDLSVLRDEIGEKHDFDWMMKAYIKHGYNQTDWPADVLAEATRISTFTTAYHRDRGEDFSDNTAENEEAFWAASQGTEYWYLFKGRQWWVKIYDEEPVLLTEAIEREQAAMAAE